jgi:anthranilate synthase component 2
VRVILNDEMSAQDVLALEPTHIMLSPGPGTPDESGISKELLVLAARARIPTLGVCLGHEVIGEVFGGRVHHARRIMHGKTSRVWHDRSAIFSNLPGSFLAARYHSLVIDKDTLPDCLKITAWTASDGEGRELDEIMAVSHKDLPIFGVQFHPESVISEHGHALLANFLDNDAAAAVSTGLVQAAGMAG